MPAPATLPANFSGWDSAPSGGAPPATLPADFDKFDQSAQQSESAPPSIGQRLRSNFTEGIGVTSDEGAKQFFEHPINTLMQSLDQQGQLALKAKAAYAKGDYKGALMYGLNYLVPFIGQQTAKAGEQLQQGDIAGGVGRTLGTATGIALGSPEVRSAVGDVASTAANAVKPAITKAAGVASDIVDPELTGIISPRLAHVQRALGRLSDTLEKSQTTHAKVAAADNAVFPGATQPEAPAPELLQSRSLSQPGSAPPEAQAAVLGKIPQRQVMMDPATGRPEFSDVIAVKQAAPEVDTSPANLQQKLNQATGAPPPLVRGVSLRNQPAAQAAVAGKVPEGFTPVDSSLLKAYRYDPEAKEFTAVLKSGQSYTHGDVSPDQVAAFEGADSQGSAWTKAIKNNSPLVRKNGVAVKPGTIGTEAGAPMPKAKAGLYDTDLTDILEQSLAAATAH